MRVLTGVWLAVIIFVISSCGKIRDPQFRRVEDFKIRQVGLGGTTVGFNITFYNPNSFSVTVKEAECNIYVDSLFAGKFVQDKPIDVGKEGEFSVPLTGNIPLATALKMDISKFISRDILFHATGDVKIGKAGIFITKPFNYQGKHQIKM